MQLARRKEIHQSKKNLNSFQSAILKTLLYFDIFNYPLNIEEIKENCQLHQIDSSNLKETLYTLIEFQLISSAMGYYFIVGKDETVNERIKNMQDVEKYHKIAKKFAKLISFFPYTRAIFITGSLSKNVISKDGDIDYMIITEPGRLWINRTLLITFKKIFLFNSRKYFCVNYFIDSQSLVIPDKNIFTATELVFAKPIYERSLCKLFIDSNIWSKDFYPNRSKVSVEGCIPSNKSVVKHILERLLSKRIGEKLDKWCFKITLQHWKNKFPNFNAEEFDLNMRSKKNVSKHHPAGFQFKVLNTHNRSITDFEKTHNVSFS